MTGRSRIQADTQDEGRIVELIADHLGVGWWHFDRKAGLLVIHGRAIPGASAREPLKLAPGQMDAGEDFLAWITANAPGTHTISLAEGLIPACELLLESFTTADKPATGKHPAGKHPAGIVRLVQHEQVTPAQATGHGDLFHQVMDSIPDPVFVHSNSEGWLVVNPAARNLLESEPVQDENGRILKLEMSRSLSRICEHMSERVLKSGKPAMIEFGARDRSEGKCGLRSWSGLWAPLRNNDGEIFAVLMHHRDVTEQSTLHGRLLRERKKLATLASTDSLTGLHNRRWFLEQAENELKRCETAELQMAVILFDIDHFKSVNDNYGHPAGDAVLVAVADILRRFVRSSDLCARWGGEEFIIALPGTDRYVAASIAEEIRARIAATPVTHDERTLSVSASFGTADVDVAGSHDIDTLTGMADNALYKAKAAGRNCVIVAGGLPCGKPAAKRTRIEIN